MPSSNNQPPKDRRKIERGHRHEELTALFYSELGFEIIERNWRKGHKEIDLIVRKEDLIAFVEVKSSSSEKFGHPAERVDRKKIKNLVACAREYIAAGSLTGVDFRFDVVTFQNGKLEHYPSAFEVP
jgi:putative endonuclease